MCCGNYPLEGWMNYDINPINKDVIKHDILTPFNFYDNTVQFINIEHALEHFTVDESYKILKEFYRILSKNGVLRITIPSFEFIKNLICEDNDIIRQYRKFQIEHYATDMEKEMLNDYPLDIVINNFYRLWGHKTIWSDKTLIQFLRQVGFSNAYVERSGHSKFKALQNIERHDREIGFNFNYLESTTIEAVK